MEAFATPAPAVRAVQVPSSENVAGSSRVLLSSFAGRKLSKHAQRSSRAQPTFSYGHVQTVAVQAAPAQASGQSSSSQEPLIIRAMRGEETERVPVWLMRQAGRYMKEYRDVSSRHSFREKSENADIATELALQPWNAYRPDAVILFSDILTPLAGMGIDFDIIKGKGPRIMDPIRSRAQIDKLRPLDPESDMHFVGGCLRNLKKEVGNDAGVLGFVGAPWTLAAYSVEGKSSNMLTNVKGLAFSDPKTFHALLAHISESIARYVCYQIENGAQAVQIFDSWAGQLGPKDWSEFSLPYIQEIVRHVKAKHPTVPLIMFANQGGGLLELMNETGVDVVSLDWMVDMAEARQRLGANVPVQGNVDPAALFGSHEFITERVLDTIRKAGRKGHVMNLGHGIIKETPVENVQHFVEVTKRAHEIL
eukprot:tig00001384_g8550.t1